MSVLEIRPRVVLPYHRIDLPSSDSCKGRQPLYHTPYRGRHLAAGGVRRWIKGWGVVVDVAVWILVMLKHPAVRRHPCAGLGRAAVFFSGPVEAGAGQRLRYAVSVALNPVQSVDAILVAGRNSRQDRVAVLPAVLIGLVLYRLNCYYACH